MEIPRVVHPARRKEVARILSAFVYCAVLYCTVSLFDEINSNLGARAFVKRTRSRAKKRMSEEMNMT